MKEKETVEVEQVIEKIEPSQLKKLQDFSSVMAEAKSKIGDLLLGYEIQKEEILSNVNVHRAKMMELEKEISDKFGKEITVDINTGVVNRKTV